MIDIEPDNLLLKLKNGGNIYIGGSAGSGKSYLVTQFAKSASNIALTATTGIAALNLRGETIHRFLGLGIASRDFEAGRIIGKWNKIKKSTKPWDVAKWKLMQNLDAIVIDEVSMLRRDQFELIDIVLSSIMDNPVAFGGIQMILVGDFFQLPPVVTNYDVNKYPDLMNPYCFQSQLWNQAGFNTFNLQTNYRQGEGDFLDALENIRVGNITDEIRELMKGRVGVDLKIPMEPVKMFSHKNTVQTENIECLKKLPEDKILSTADFEGKKYDVDILEKECPAESKLYFCKDAQIMMLTNDSAGRWVNGTMGIIKNVDPVRIKLSTGETVTINTHKWERTIHKVMPNNTISTGIVATMTQYPFKLSWATTIHRSQGLTLDYVDLDLTKCFAPGQAYVALSRAKTLEGLRLRSWNDNSIKTDPRVKKFYGV